MLEAIQVSLDSLNLVTLAPMLIAVAGGLLILVLDLIDGKLDKTLYVMLTMLWVRYWVSTSTTEAFSM